jgi:Ni/Fe-hydrogenase subunit HybB-like protein
MGNANCDYGLPHRPERRVPHPLSLTYVFRKEEYQPISRIAVFLAIVLIFGAMVGIALDLGRPEKSWRLFMFLY